MATEIDDDRKVKIADEFDVAVSDGYDPEEAALLIGNRYSMTAKEVFALYKDVRGELPK